MTAPRFEVHEHSYVSGPHKQGHYHRDGTWCTSKFAHSHEDGNRRHEHPETGPAYFTIDQDEWYRATGLKGGGRKTYTKAPSGEQFPLVECERNSFRVVFCHSDYSPELERAGISEEQYEQSAAEFKDAADGQIPTIEGNGPDQAGAAVARMAIGFDLDVIYEYHDRRTKRPA